MELSDVLSKIGLSDKESRVYLALLELGTASVQSIASKASIKRPTTYLILDDLLQKGLVSVVPRAKKALYQAEPPDNLLGDLHRREELMKRFLPSLQAIYNTRKEKPQVQLFEGREGVKQVYDKILSAKEIKFFATIRDFIKFYPEFAQNLINKTKERLVTVQEILTQHSEDIAFAKGIEQNQFYQNRFMPKGKEFLTDNVVFDNNVIFFSFHPRIFAVMITSRSISESIRTLFEAAWQSAQTYEEVITALQKT